MPMMGMAGTRTVLNTKRAPKTFAEAFVAVVLDRVGVTLTSTPFRQEDMDRELQQAQRLDGFAGDAGRDAFDILGPPNTAKEGGVWSDNSEELLTLVRQLGNRSRHLSSEHFLKPFFRHLCMPELSIRELDDDMARFAKLTFLDVSRNGLVSIDNLPPNLKYLKAYNNPLSRVCCKPTPSLAFFGAGYSNIGAEGLDQIARRFKGLLSLDLGFSLVAGLRDLVTPLGPLQRLRQLYVAGNPVCLLPYYRLQTLRWLTQLSVLDGAAVSDQEQADAQALATSGVPLRSRPSSIRLGFQMHNLSGARVLFERVAKRIVAEKRAAEAAAAAAAEAAGTEVPPPAEAMDAILEACAGGALKLRLLLPDGEWACSSEVRLDAAEAALWAAATPENPPPAFDSFFLKNLRTEAGEPLYFEVDVGEEGSEANGEVLQEDGLVRLCAWIRRGATVKFFYRPPVPSMPSEQEVSAGGGGAGGGEAEDVAVGPPAVEDVEIGGCVVGLGSWLGRLQNDVSDEARAASEIPDVPAPWRVTVPEIRVVSDTRWLEPEVQVPPLDPRQQRKAQMGDAKLSLMCELYAGEPPPLEEEPKPPVPDPKAKKK